MKTFIKDVALVMLASLAGWLARTNETSPEAYALDTPKAACSASADATRTECSALVPDQEICAQIIGAAFNACDTSGRSPGIALPSIAPPLLDERKGEYGDHAK